MHLTTGNLLDRSDKYYVFLHDDRDVFNTFSFETGSNLGLSYFRVSENGNFYRIGLIGLNISESRQFKTILPTFTTQTVDGDDQSFSRVSTQFEVGKFFKRDKLSLGMGVFVRPEYLFFKSIPESISAFDLRINEFSINTGFNPIVEVALSDNLMITAQVPMGFSEIRLYSVAYETPFLVDRDRKTEEFTTEFEFSLALQLGLTAAF